MTFEKEIALLFSVVLLPLYGCIYEDLPECPPQNGVILSYDFLCNMEYEDELGEAVQDLKTFVFDSNGILCDTLCPPVGAGELCLGWQRKIDLAPGMYTIVTWAGSEEFDQDFQILQSTCATDESVCSPVIGKTNLKDFRVFLNYSINLADNDRAIPQTRQFKDLFHGLAENVVVEKDKETLVHTSLIKNSNVVRVGISGWSKTGINSENIQENWDIHISGRNGHYKYDNTIKEYAPLLTYTTYDMNLSSDTVYAYIKVMRLMGEEEDSFSNAPLYLDVVYKPTNLVVCRNLDIIKVILDSRIPLRDEKGNIDTDSNGDPIMVLPGVEYLDRQDFYTIDFEETESEGNIRFTIYVNGWKVQDIYPVFP